MAIWDNHPMDETGKPKKTCKAQAAHRRSDRPWKGTLGQYAGRLHREYASKTDVRIIDFVDTGHPALLRM